jgi:SNF2 family DNA or RNA helicase
VDTYQQFLDNKLIAYYSSGIDVDNSQINDKLFPFQKDVTTWALKKGRAAVFLDTGLGKTFIQLEWARLIGVKTLIVAPLSVARQTVREAKKLDIDLVYIRDKSEIIDSHNLYITNYEMLDKFDMSKFEGVVLDESSILKSIDGKTRGKLIDMCKNIPFRLCCTATAARPAIMFSWTTWSTRW